MPTPVATRHETAQALAHQPALELRGSGVSPLSDLESAALLFRGLGHPLRLRILLALEHETLSPSDLEQRLQVGLGLVAYHVRTLRADGLLELVNTRMARGSLQSFYRLSDRGRRARRLLEVACRETGDAAERR